HQATGGRRQCPLRRTHKAMCAIYSGGMVHREESHVDFGAPYDLPRTLAVLQRGRGDPGVQVDPGASGRPGGGTPGAGAWLCRRVYDPSAELGQLTYRFDQVDASRVRVRAVATSAAAAEQAVQSAPALLGFHDDWQPLHRLLEDRDDH